jgi:hypothetical protein
MEDDFPIPALWKRDSPASTAVVHSLVSSLNALFITSPVATGPYERLLAMVLRVNLEMEALPEAQRSAARRGCWCRR